MEALRQIPRLKPAVALVDARMPRMDGIELIRRLSEAEAEAQPRVAAIVLTTFDDDEYVFGGLRADAKGYLLNDTSPEDLVSAIKKVSRGETVLGSPVAELARSSVPKVEQTEGETEILSKREIEVTRLVGRGATNAEIAGELYISEGTAKNNVSKILRKLGLRDRTQLALYAARHWPEEQRR